MRRFAWIVTIAALLVLGSGCQRAAPSLEERAKGALAQTKGRLPLSGLSKQVEVLRDQWGVPHIYAQSADDLFFAQGFVAAQDRMFQLDLWRRAGAGELAEILGPSYIERDRFARLMRYRGDMQAEWPSYSPDAKAILTSFARGVNAFIATSGDKLPIEFQLLGIRPGVWKPEDSLLRIAGLLMSRNAVSEVVRAQLIERLGPELTEALLPPEPPVKIESLKDPLLAGIDTSMMRTLEAAIGPARFDEKTEPGSNNWVIDGTMSATGKPLLANDPHRPVVLPSLRYLAHLVAPGWNVIGSGEPALPGIAVGHNERIAFGFTIVPIDQEDLYVEKTNPQNPNQYRYQGQWRDMQVEHEKISVKGRPEPVDAALKFTVHGPVIHEDPAHNRVFAMRWVGTEPGTAGYLPSLALDRAQNWQQALEALERWKVPTENIVYADVDGNIGWVAAGMTPVRNWSGLVPIEDEAGKYEWKGFLPVSEHPQRYNPPEHYIATANHNILPRGYRHQLGFEWTPPFRFGRIDEVLKSGIQAGKKFTIEDFEKLQHDATSIEARKLVELLKAAPGSDPSREMLTSWDCVLSKDSAAAALYELWVRRLKEQFLAERVPADVRALAASRFNDWTMIELLKREPPAKRNALLTEALRDAAAEAVRRMGEDVKQWRWGALHHIRFHHPLALDAERRKLFDLGPVERGGDSNTVFNTGGTGFQQTSGASYREIFDVADWDRSVATSVPGQSGQPASPHYADLLPLWADGKYFPLPFTRAAVEKYTTQKLILEPK